MTLTITITDEKINDYERMHEAISNPLHELLKGTSDYINNNIILNCDKEGDNKEFCVCSLYFLTQDIKDPVLLESCLSKVPELVSTMFK